MGGLTTTSSSLASGLALAHLRLPLNDRRRRHVEKIFKIIDSEGSGTLSKGQLWNYFQGQLFDDVKFKKRTKQDLFDELYSMFDTDGHGELTLDNWMSFYIDFS